jgi:hypothetical protein
VTLRGLFVNHVLLDILFKMENVLHAQLKVVKAVLLQSTFVMVDLAMLE